MQTWALVLGIIGTVAGLMAGGAAIYSLVISHRALRFEKEKWEESKKVKIRVELRHDLEVGPPADDDGKVKITSVVTMRAYNEGSVPVRLTQGWFQVGPEKKGSPALSEYFDPNSQITVQPNDSQKVSCTCAELAKRAIGLGIEKGRVEINGYFYDSFRRVYRNEQPYFLNVEMFYKDGTYIEDPLTYVAYANCPDCGSECLKIPSVDEIIQQQADKKTVTEQPPEEEPPQ